MFKWVAIVLLVISCADPASGAWILARKIDLGYSDRLGRHLEDISGRNNRFPGGAFYHKGTLYPDLAAVTVLERHETAGELLVRTDQTDEDAMRFLAGQATKRCDVARFVFTKEGSVTVGKVSRSWADFKARVLTEAEALATLKACGRVSDQAPAVFESGVTK